MHCSSVLYNELDAVLQYELQLHELSLSSVSQVVFFSNKYKD